MRQNIVIHTFRVNPAAVGKKSTGRLSQLSGLVSLHSHAV